VRSLSALCALCTFDYVQGAGCRAQGAGRRVQGDQREARKEAALDQMARC